MTESDGEKPHHIKAGIEPCTTETARIVSKRVSALTNSATGSSTIELNFGVFPHHKRKYNSE